MVKPGSNGKVFAKNTYTVLPLFKSLSSKVVHVINEDCAAIEDNLTIEKPAQPLSQITQEGEHF